MMSIILLPQPHMNLMSLISYVADYGFDLSNLYGIPGSIGGAVINNAGRMVVKSAIMYLRLFVLIRNLNLP